jgi:hypothetical protein
MKDLFEHSRLRRAALLMAAAIVIDVSLGWLVQTRLQWPLFLDSVGTILSGALLGPLAGAAVGVLSNVIEGLLPGSESAPAYAVTAAFIGWAAGYAASLGAFRRLWSVALTGLLVGLGALLISAPITAYVFHGVTGTGMDQWLVHLRNTGANLLQIATVQGFLSDPFDKLLSFLLACSPGRPGACCGAIFGGQGRAARGRCWRWTATASRWPPVCSPCCWPSCSCPPSGPASCRCSISRCWSAPGAAAWGRRC